ncbi:MAG: hypothetical protein ACP5TV_06470 [Anaerolineae bacterium]
MGRAGIGVLPRSALWALTVLSIAAVLAVPASAGAPRRVFLPAVYGPGGAACGPFPAQSYASLPIEGRPTDRPAALHPDLNLALRGYRLTSAYLGLVDISGPADPGAPQLAGLFADRRRPEFTAAYQVYDWDWASGQRGQPITEPAVTLVRLAAGAGESVHVPDSGYTLGNGFEVLVLYAEERRITLKYTREDSVVQGYTLQLEGVCVHPVLLALYRRLDAAGRAELPALRAGQLLGVSPAVGIGVAVRDAGRFLDPRSRKDWWQGY